MAKWLTDECRANKCEDCDPAIPTENSIGHLDVLICEHVCHKKAEREFVELTTSLVDGFFRQIDEAVEKFNNP